MTTKQSRKFNYLLTLILIALAGTASAQFREIDVPVAYFEKRVEQPGYGPSALRIAPNGTLWIANPADNSLTALDPEGWTIQHFQLEAVGITDVQFAESGELLVLDSSAEEPAVLNVTRDGTLRDRRPLRRTQPLQSTLANEPTAIVRALALTHDWPRNTAALGRWRIRPGSEGSPNAVMQSGDVTIEIGANRGVIRGVRILHESANGVYVLVEEVTDGEAIDVDATVRRFSKTGEFLGTGRVPLAEQYTYVHEPVAVAADGTVYLLTTRPGTARISVLTFEKPLPEILPERRQPYRDLVTTATPVNNAATSPISRAQMEANARAYLQNSTYYPQNALTGHCAGRTAPRHLGRTPRVIGSVAYDWGGWDTVADYNRFIANGSAAGDIDTNSQSCSKGVDCSGFVGRAWGLTDKKRNTCMFGDVAKVIALDSLQKGDVLTKCNDHIVMFESRRGSNGIYAYESTVNDAVDRVVYAPSSWSRLRGYTAMRYSNVLTEATTPLHVASSYTPSTVSLSGIGTIRSTWKNADSTPITVTLSVRTPGGATYNYTMGYVSGTTATGALFETRIGLPFAGRYDYAVTAVSLTTGRASRHPASGFAPGPTAINNTVMYRVNPSNTPVCGQYPVTIRVQSYVAAQNIVRFVVTKGNNSCYANGNFIANGAIDIRADGPFGPVVAAAHYGAGASQVTVDVAMNLSRGSVRHFYATVRNQGYWTGPIQVWAQ